MNRLYDAVLILGIGVSVYGGVVAILTIRTILSNRDQLYRAQYTEFLEQRRRIRRDMDRREDR